MTPFDARKSAGPHQRSANKWVWKLSRGTAQPRPHNPHPAAFMVISACPSPEASAMKLLRPISLILLPAGLPASGGRGAMPMTELTVGMYPHRGRGGGDARPPHGGADELAAACRPTTACPSSSPSAGPTATDVDEEITRPPLPVAFLTSRAASSTSRTCSPRPRTTTAPPGPAAFALEMNQGWFRQKPCIAPGRGSAAEGPCGPGAVA